MTPSTAPTVVCLFQIRINEPESQKKTQQREYASNKRNQPYLRISLFSDFPFSDRYFVKQPQTFQMMTKLVKNQQSNATMRKYVFTLSFSPFANVFRSERQTIHASRTATNSTSFKIPSIVFNQARFRQHLPPLSSLLPFNCCVSAIFSLFTTVFHP